MKLFQLWSAMVLTALVGGRGRFEIWNLQRWKRAHEEETPTYQHVANVIGL
jgi:DNA-binding transcriptional regulator/RsmH inhibitor MraZ